VAIILIYCLLIFLFIFIYDWVPKGFYKRLHWTLYTFIEYGAFSSILWLSIHNNKFKALIIIVSVFFISFQILYFLSAKLDYLDSISIGIETILIFIYSFYFLYQEFQKPDQSIIKNPMFWIVCGIVFYLAGTFFFNILIETNHQSVNKYWFYSYSFDIIKNVLFAFVISSFTKEKKTTVGKDAPYLDMDHLDFRRSY
jgi:hypothetical protein